MEKIISSRIQILSAAAFILMLTGCSFSETAQVTIDLGVPVRPMGSVSLNSALAPSSGDSAFAGIQRSVNAPTDVQMILIAVFEGDYIKENLLASAQYVVDTHVYDDTSSMYLPTSATLEIPAGDNRRFIVYGVTDDAYSDPVIRYIGSTHSTSGDTITLKGGESVVININMNRLRKLVTTYTYNNPTLSISQGLYDPYSNNWLENSYIVYGVNTMYAPIGVVYRGPSKTNIDLSSIDMLYIDSILGYSEVFGLPAAFVSD